MAEQITKSQVDQLIGKINQSLSVSLNPEDFKSAAYSESSLTDLFVQKIVDELNGDWTSDMAYHKLRSAVLAVTGRPASDIHQDTDLSLIFPSSGRKASVAQLSEHMGVPLQILKPNRFLYGLFIFLFFASIPFGIGMDWFLSGCVMIASLAAIFILGKTGNNFRVKTLGQMADELAWKNYLRQSKDAARVDESEIRKKVESLLK